MHSVISLYFLILGFILIFPVSSKAPVEACEAFKLLTLIELSLSLYRSTTDVVEAFTWLLRLYSERYRAFNPVFVRILGCYPHSEAVEASRVISLAGPPMARSLAGHTNEAWLAPGEVQGLSCLALALLRKRFERFDLSCDFLCHHLTPILVIFRNYPE